MVFSITDEVIIFLSSCLAGGCMMLFYDVLSLAEAHKKSTFLLINICDGIWIVLCCITMVFMTFTVCNGIIRAFEFFGVFLGAVIYKLTLSRLILMMLKKIIRFVVFFFQLFFKILLTPLIIMYKMVSRCMQAVFMPVFRILKRMAKHLSFRVGTRIRLARKIMRKS